MHVNECINSQQELVSKTFNDINRTDLQLNGQVDIKKAFNDFLDTILCISSEADRIVSKEIKQKL